MANEEIEYESDPEEAKMSLKMRRREASDDEAEEGGETVEKPLRRVDDSDGESEGAAAEYEDEFEEEEEQEVYDLDEYVEEIEEVGYEESGGARGDDGVKAVAVDRDEAVDGGDGGVLAEMMEEKNGLCSDTGEINNEKNDTVKDGQPEEEKKEMEPYAVPTAGAFYMHDDRFQDNARGRNRRTPGGRRLWESKDERKWGHDKFEELTLQERGYEERGRGSRGRYRGRGKNRTSSRGGYARENSSHSNNNQNNAPKGVRGRGARRYHPSFKNNEAPRAQNKQSGKPDEKPPYVTTVRTSETLSTAEPDAILSRKQVVSSNLNIASPPFYPSGSSTKEQSAPNKEDVQAGSMNRNGQPSVMGDSFTMGQSSGTPQGKITGDSGGVNNSLFGKPGNNIQISQSGSSSPNSTQHQFRGQGRGVASSTRMVYQPAISNNQLQTIQINPVQSRSQTSVQASGQQFTQCVPNASQSSSPPETTGNAFESGGLESTPELRKSKTELVPKGKDNMQGSGMGPFLYGGAQVMGGSGNIGSGQGDQNFPAFLQFMQLGGQHPRGMGVPAVGMAFPGYIGQPQLGRGNSEMTWLPVLAGAAGSLGSTYCPPYIGVDSSFNAHPSGQTSSVTSASSQENNSANVSNDWKSAQKPELANDDFVQRQKNPRRYTEMKFDQ